MTKHLPLIAAGALVAALALTGCGATTVRPPAEGGDAPVVEATEAPAAPSGTRENPAPLGSTVEGGDWSVTINSVTLAATDAVMAENPFNSAPEEGYEYILVNYTATYTGDDPDGQMAAFVSIDYVTPEGNTIDGLSALVVAPDAIDSMSTLYSGASVTGNKALAVPSATAGQGVLAVRPGMLADKVFVAVM